MAFTRGRKGSREKGIEDTDEAYWYTSEIKSTIFDDKPTILGVNRNEMEMLSKTVAKNVLLDTTDEDTINWDGSSTASDSSTGVLSADFKSVRYKPQQTKQGDANTSHNRSMAAYSKKSSIDSTFVIVPDKSSGESYGNTATSFSRSSPTSIVDEVQHQTLTVTGMAKLESELQRVKRQLLVAQRDRWEKLSVKDTIKRIINNDPYSLEMYKSKEEKLALLDSAISFCDGNAITAVTLYLKNTIKSQIFNQELIIRPQAISHYISYLKSYKLFSELADVLGMLGRTEEVAMLQFQLINTPDAQDRVKNLKKCLQGHFLADPILAKSANVVQDQIDLLEMQMPIEEYDSQVAAAGKAQIFIVIPRKASIIGMSAITTLYYCCLYHYNIQENALQSPRGIQLKFRLSEKQFLWVALSALSRVKRWDHIEKLFLSKNFLGRTKMKSVIAFNRIVDVLSKTKAPTEVLDKYLRLIDNIEERLSLAKKLKCHVCVIDTLVQLRDRRELVLYSSSLQNGTDEKLHAELAIRNEKNRWKN